MLSLDLDDTSAMKQIRALGLYITCLKIIKLIINQRYQKYVLDLRKEDYKPRDYLLLQAFAYGGGAGGSRVCITYFRFIGNKSKFP
jgi:hypothetical protein